MSHLNKTRRNNPGMSLSQAMKKASKTYKKKRRQRGGQLEGADQNKHEWSHPKVGARRTQMIRDYYSKSATGQARVVGHKHDHTDEQIKANPEEWLRKKLPGIAKDAGLTGSEGADSLAEYAKLKKPEEAPKKLDPNTEKTEEVKEEEVKKEEVKKEEVKAEEPVRRRRASRGGRRRRKSRRRRRQRGGVQGNFDNAEKAAVGLNGGRRRRRRSRRRRRQRGGQVKPEASTDPNAGGGSDDSKKGAAKKAEDGVPTDPIDANKAPDERTLGEHESDPAFHAKEEAEGKPTGDAGEDGAGMEGGEGSADQESIADPDAPSTPGENTTAGGRRRRRSRRRRRNSRRGGRRRRSSRRSSRRRRRRRRSSRRRR